ncbi:signal peptidase I [Robertmurraya kyonggiensis]|uniref:Signal peptidase I n=1 Tax=Robertmurraya kyonggiensis TaxID=1037680 RepID=A0A4U1D4P1_9BACI|nr:signal peptidase I [Robertmurraya kyonggiensis]TKC16818.1 signal peptidase I [Robertmurraya kyonggiensis]
MRAIGGTFLHEEETKATKNPWSEVLSWVKFIAILFVLFFIFRFALGIIIVDGNSMNPTLKNHDVILTSNIFFQPERNDVIIINTNDGYDIVKRVIALPNETVEIKNGIVLINGQPLEEVQTVGVSNDMAEVLVQEGTYFVMGDNRTPGESLDSRSSEVGLISQNNIKGEAFISVFSIKPL